MKHLLSTPLAARPRRPRSCSDEDEPLWAGGTARAMDGTSEPGGTYARRVPTARTGRCGPIAPSTGHECGLYPGGADGAFARSITRPGRWSGVGCLSLLLALAAVATAAAQDVTASSVSETGPRTVIVNPSCVGNVGVLADGATGTQAYCISPIPDPSYTIAFTFSPQPSQFMSGIRIWANGGGTYDDGELRQFDLEIDHIDPVTNTPETLRLDDVNIGDTVNIDDPKFVSLTGTTPAGLYQVSAVRLSDMRGTINQVILREVKGVFAMREVPASQVTVSQVGSFLQARAQLILQHQPDLTRRIERLEGRYHDEGGISAFGFSTGNDGFPFVARIGTDESSFAYSLRRSRSGDSTASPRASDPVSPARDPGAASAAAGLRPTRPANHPADWPFSSESDATDARGLPSSTIPERGRASAASRSDAASQGLAAGAVADGIDVWVEGRFSRFDVSGGDGALGTLFVGVDHLVTDDVLLGLVAQGDWTTMDASTGGDTRGSGYLIGPYAIGRVTESLYLDARLGWGRSENSISPFGTYTDDFDAKRWLVTAALVGSVDRYGLVITPEARVSYFSERSTEYRDTLGATIPVVEVETGIFEFGPTISKFYPLGNGSVIAPFATVEGIWTFAQKNTASRTAGVASIADEGLRARVEMGLDFYDQNDTTLNMSLNYDGIGDSDFEAWGLGFLYRRAFR